MRGWDARFEGFFFSALPGCPDNPFLRKIISEIHNYLWTVGKSSKTPVFVGYLPRPFVYRPRHFRICRAPAGRLEPTDTPAVSTHSVDL